MLLAGLFMNVALAQVSIPSQYIPENVPMKELLKTTEGASAKITAATGANYLLQKIANGLIYIAAPLAVLFIVHAGVSYAMAVGDQTKIDAAKKELIWAVLGLIIIILAVIMVRMLVGFFFLVPEILPAGGTTTQQTGGNAQIPIVP